MIFKTIRIECVLASIVLVTISAAVAQPLSGIPGHTQNNLESLPKSQNLPAQIAGQWTVTFANGVVETCDIGQNDMTKVEEPQRSSSGKARIREGDLTILFDDDRMERWTRVGSLMVVEHWFPTAAFASARPVLGIAKRSGE